MRRAPAEGLAGLGSLSLNLSLYFPEKKKKNNKGKKKKRRVETGFGHEDNFHGLGKMCMVQENRKGQV